MEGEQEKDKNIRSNYEDYETMRHITRAGFGFVGGVAFTFGAILLASNQIVQSILFMVVGIGLVLYGYKG